MTGAALRVENVSKSFSLAVAQERPTTLGEAALLSARRLFMPSLGERETFWALRDVSFEVEPGEVLGILGANGAGKSTLLKVLARITPPTSGRALVRGRLASLLEVGTGFHPELTGRENIYLNGAILGMRRWEIDRRFDDIVAFSGVGRFLETPVKRYSSGMYVRLAFSVAAHLEPDVLVVDEVLSVGDVEFQRKCLGRMQEVTKSGRTVVFVSHSLPAVRALCTRGLLLEGGRVAFDGGTADAIDRYLKRVTIARNGDVPEDAPCIGTGEARIRRVELLNSDGEPTSHLLMGEPARVAITIDVKARITDAVVEVGISSLDGTRATTSYSVDGGRDPWLLVPGRQKVVVELDARLTPGEYTIDAAVHHQGPPYTCDQIERVYNFSQLNVPAVGADAYPFNLVRGYVRSAGRWSMSPSEESGARSALIR